MDHPSDAAVPESLYTKGTWGNLPGWGRFHDLAAHDSSLSPPGASERWTPIGPLLLPHAFGNRVHFGTWFFGRPASRATAPDASSRLHRVGRTIPGPISVRKLQHRVFRSLAMPGTTFPPVTLERGWRNRPSLTQPKPNGVAGGRVHGLLSTPSGRGLNARDAQRNLPCVRQLRQPPDEVQSPCQVPGDLHVHSKVDPRGG